VFLTGWHVGCGSGRAGVLNVGGGPSSSGIKEDMTQVLIDSVAAIMLHLSFCLFSSSRIAMFSNSSGVTSSSNSSNVFLL